MWGTETHLASKGGTGKVGWIRQTDRVDSKMKRAFGTDRMGEDGPHVRRGHEGRGVD